MYFKSIRIKHVGPIEELFIEFSMSGDHPKPIIIVGENGTGKSIILSHLVNSLIVGQQEVFDNSDVTRGMVYKLRNPSYIMSGKYYSYSSVKFSFDDVKVQECQLNKLKSDFKDIPDELEQEEWNKISDTELSSFSSTFSLNPKSTADFFKKQCCLYFPVNRFEEPAWLNVDNLESKASYTELKQLVRFSNRNIINTSPLKNNKNWLLDILFDRGIFELNLIGINGEFPKLLGYKGKCSTIFDEISNLLKIILETSEPVRLGVGSRKNRRISVIKNEKPWIPDLFQLSTGEIQLLNLFLSIIRDYDLSEGSFNSLSDIKGIVIIDEIDSHLHTSYQKEVLPELIASFPNVQFIITTHSPLFIMGIDKKFGNDNFSIFNMPTGESLSPADFSEFNAAYDAFKETATHRQELQRVIEQDKKPIVFVEGDYDIRYLRKAALLLGKEMILESVQLEDGEGYGNLDKIWKTFDNRMSGVLPKKILLLYDCDTKKKDTNEDIIYKRVIPSVGENPIEKGIENLFPTITIDKVQGDCPQYIDITEETKARERGKEITHPAVKSVNKDEKGNMCNWLCQHGNAEDFKSFVKVFDIIEKIIEN